MDAERVRAETVPITRNLLSQQVRDAVIERIVDGRLPAGKRVNESELAVELGVSRTPLREALHHLAQQRFVDARPGRGFVVASLSRQDVQQVYPLVSLLEAFALRTGRAVPDVDQARGLNEEMLAQKDDPEACLAIDARFHAVLVAGCDNELLINTLRNLKRLMQRYERAYMQQTVARSDDERTVMTSVAEHRVILDALDRGDREAAASAVDVNWRNGMDELLRLLEAAEAEPDL